MPPKSEKHPSAGSLSPREQGQHRARRLPDVIQPTPLNGGTLGRARSFPPCLNNLYFLIEERDGAVQGPLRSLPTVAGGGGRQHFVNGEEFGVIHPNLPAKTRRGTRSDSQKHPGGSAELCSSSAPCPLGLGLAGLAGAAGSPPPAPRICHSRAGFCYFPSQKYPL